MLKQRVYLFIVVRKVFFNRCLNLGIEGGGGRNYLLKDERGKIQSEELSYMVMRKGWWQKRLVVMVW